MTEQEHIRHALLRTLYGTRAIRVSTPFLHTAMRNECRAAPATVDAEIVFLTDAELMDTEPDGVGSSDYWKLTAAGVLHYERHR